jgi:transketolase
MRDTFISTLLPIAKRDSRIVMMTGDLGFGVLDEFRAACPDQLLNVGVAEQNLAGVGAGLALTGHIVFTYSIGNFPTLRCLEQIRNDVCYHAANVKIVTVGGGMAYGSLGYTHFAVEDLAIMRSLPGMTVVAPGDPHEVELLVPQIVERPGPVYLRLGRAGERTIHDPTVDVKLGSPTMLAEGDDVLLLTTGGMLPVAKQAADELTKVGVAAGIASVHTLSPFPTKEVVNLARRYPLVVTCEEHTVSGGLGGAVAEALAENAVHCVFRRFGLDAGLFPVGVGSQEYLRDANGIGPAALVELTSSLLQRRT